MLPNIEFIEEFTRDFEEGDYDCGHNSRLPDERIVLDPEIAHGKLIIRGTRVPVAVILGALAGGIENR